MFPRKVNTSLNPLTTKAYKYFALALFCWTGLLELHDPARLLQFFNHMITTFIMQMDNMAYMIITHVVKCANEAAIMKAKLLV